jgi:hypothetical protein
MHLLSLLKSGEDVFRARKRRPGPTQVSSALIDDGVKAVDELCEDAEARGFSLRLKADGE